MKNTKRRNVNIAIAIIALLLVSSTLIVFSSYKGDSTASAQTTSNPLSERINPLTGEQYGDPLQYEWMRSGLSFSKGNDPTMIQSSGGPAPNRPDTLWSLKEAALSDRADLGTVVSGQADAFIGGFVFIRSQIGTQRYINALDPYTGSLEYQIPTTTTIAISKVNDDHFRAQVGTSWMVYETANGNWAYNVTNAPPQGTGGVGGGNIIPEAQIAITTLVGTNGTMRWTVAYDLSTIDTDHKTPELWRYTTQWTQSPGSAMGVFCYGDGKLFFGCEVDNTVYVVDARNGTLVWGPYYSNAVARAALYYDGKFILNGLQREVTCFDADTGEILWTWEGGLRAWFGSGGCAWGGMFFAYCVDTPAGFFAAWDVNTGELLWKIKGYYYINYFSPTVDDGKVYIMITDATGLNDLEIRTAGVRLSACVDAYTGQTLWTLPLLFNKDIVAQAYGCLYTVQTLPLTSVNVLYCISDLAKSDWTYYRGNPSQPGLAIGQSPPEDISHATWNYTTDGPINSSPAVVDGKVYVGTQGSGYGQGGTYYCLDAYTGEKIWNFTTKYRIMSSPAVSGGMLFTGTDDGNIYCLNAETGDQVWAKDVGGKWNGSLTYYTQANNQYRSSPVVIGNRLYVGSIDSKVYCLDTGSGAIQWSYTTGGPIFGSPCYYNGVIFITSSDILLSTTGRLYAIDATSGVLKWVNTVPNAAWAFTQSPTLTATPIIAEKIPSNTSANAKELGPMLLCGGGNAQFIYGFNVTTGEQARFQNGTLYSMQGTSGGGTPVCYAPTYYNGTIYGSMNLRIVAWNASDGRALWQQWVIHNVNTSPALSVSLSGVKLYVCTDVGAILCFNATTISRGYYSNGTYYGSEANKTSQNALSTYEALGLAMSSPAIWEDKVYIGHGDHNVYCFDGSPTIPISVWANSDKGATMWANETITIDGKVHATTTYHVDAVPGVTSNPIDETNYPGIPNATVKAVFVKPDLSSVEVDAVTDSKGAFTVQYNPNVVGQWSWTVWYQGKVFPGESYRYSEAYSPYSTVQVTSPTAGGVSPTATPPQVTSGVPIEYIYAAVAAIAIVVIAIGAYAYTKRTKKQQP